MLVRLVASIGSLVLASCATTETVYNTSRNADTVSVIGTATHTVQATIGEPGGSVALSR